MERKTSIKRMTSDETKSEFNSIREGVVSLIFTEFFKFVNSSVDRSSQSHRE